MKKVSTVAAQSKQNFVGKLTIGLDLGDRTSWSCVLDEAGKVIHEQKLGTAPKAMRETFEAIPRSRVALETGTHSPWVSRLLSEMGHEVIVAHAKIAFVTLATCGDFEARVHKTATGFRQVSRYSRSRRGRVFCPRVLNVALLPVSWQSSRQRSS
jgi:hypothetical protein